MGSKLITNLIIILLVLAALYAGYEIFTRATSTSTSLEDIDVTAAIEGDQGGEAELAADLSLLQSLKAIQLNDELLRNPIFTTVLVDFSRPLPERDPGRVNPFLPPEVAPITPRSSTAQATTSVSSSRSTSTTTSALGAQ